MKYLIVGLGNPGPEYQDTRHNIGWKMLDAFCDASNVTFQPSRYALSAETKFKGRILCLIKPLTYMNLSGKAVDYWMKKENIPVENILVLLDDLALPFGTLRLRAKGSDAGHNGLKNIDMVLGIQNYARLRFGIGNDFSSGGQVNYVLGKFPATEEKLLPEKLKMVTEIIQSFVFQGIERTMNNYNKR
jgi:PTH1 family peptidyl-tRNA hydrolase